MIVAQARWSDGRWDELPPPAPFDLVLLFGSPSRLASGLIDDVRARFAGAVVLGGSTAGEIVGARVHDDSLTLTAVRFARARVAAAEVRLAAASSSYDAGLRLARALDPNGLIHLFVLSDGTQVNGSDLARGLAAGLPAGVQVTGGLCGDGANFRQTLVALDGPAESGKVVAVGFYGAGLRIGVGSLGGWDPFGPERLVTRAVGNVVYELDGCSALELYKRYLGEHSTQLPASGLLFPLSVRSGDAPGLVRTILAVDEAAQSITFAGDVPEGAYARLMRANTDRLVDGAQGAARICLSADAAPELAVLVSCVGRKLVLKQRVEEEVEAVRDVLGARTRLTGFYSYGELSPFAALGRCELHNQTMTITTFGER